jgi:hypothetical protein
VYVHVLKGLACPCAVATTSIFNMFAMGTRPCFVFINSCLYPQIVRMLTGMEVSPIAVQNSLEKLFPEERTLALAAKKAALAKKAAPVDGEEADGDAHAKASEPDAAVDARDVNTKTLAGPLNVRDVAMVGTVFVLGA